MLEQKEITSENTWTPWKFIADSRDIDLSVSGLSDSTVTLQRKFTKYGDILDVDTFTADSETYFNVSASAYYRIGVKTGEYGSDTIKVKMVS